AGAHQRLRTRGVPGHGQLQQAERPCGVAPAHAELQPAEPPGWKDVPGSVHHPDAVVHGRAEAFTVVDELLLELLARAQPGEHYGDVLVRLESREPDHLARQVRDAHRTAHLEDVGRTRLAGR